MEYDPHAADRRHADRRLHRGRPQGLHLHPRRVSLPDRMHGSAPSPKPTSAAGSARISRAPVSTSTSTPTPARAPMNAVKNRRCSIRSKASAASRASEAPLSRCLRRLAIADPAEQRRDLLRRSRRSSAMAARLSRLSALRRMAARGWSAFPGMSTSRVSTKSRSASTCCKFIDDFGGGMRGGKKLKAVVPGGSSCPAAESGRVRHRHGLRHLGQGQEHARLGRHGGSRRRHLHGEVRAPHHALLCA